MFPWTAVSCSPSLVLYRLSHFSCFLIQSCWWMRGEAHSPQWCKYLSFSYPTELWVFVAYDPSASLRHCSATAWCSCVKEVHTFNHNYWCSFFWIQSCHCILFFINQCSLKNIVSKLHLEWTLCSNDLHGVAHVPVVFTLESNLSLQSLHQVLFSLQQERPNVCHRGTNIPVDEAWRATGGWSVQWNSLKTASALPHTEDSEHNARSDLP